MKAQANQIRPGWVLDHNGKQYSVTKINIIQPGKGGAFIQVEMRDVSNGIISVNAPFTKEMLGLHFGDYFCFNENEYVITNICYSSL